MGDEYSAEAALQCAGNSALDERFHAWNARTVDLPGVYFLQVAEWLFREDRLARGCFPALGRPARLSDIEAPMFILAAADDEIVALPQAVTAKSLCRATSVAVRVEPGRHLSLFPAEKLASDKAAGVENPSGASNAVFAGTSVISGTAAIVVCRTGGRTALGHLATSLAEKPPATAFAIGVRRFGMLVMRLTILMVLFVLVINISFHRPVLESLMFALALAVGLTPELLPDDRDGHASPLGDGPGQAQGDRQAPFGDP